MLENAASIQASAADDLFYSINDISALMRADLPMVLFYDRFTALFWLPYFK